MKDRIKKLRCDNGLNQSELASIMGIKQSSLSLIERGINNPTVSQIELLSRYFGVSTDYLIFGVESIKPMERELLMLIKEDSGLMQSLMCALTAKKNVLNRLAA